MNSDDGVDADIAVWLEMVASEAEEARPDWTFIERRVAHARSRQTMATGLLITAAAVLVAFAVLKWPLVVSTITGRMPPDPAQTVAVKRVVEFPVDPDLQSSLAQVFETPQRMPQTAVLKQISVAVTGSGSGTFATRIVPKQIAYATFTYAWNGANVQVTESILTQPNEEEITVVEPGIGTGMRKVIARTTNRQFVIEGAVSAEQLLQLSMALLGR